VIHHGVTVKTLAALLLASALLPALPRAESVGKLLKDGEHNLNAGLLVDAKLDLEAVLGKKPGNEKAKILLSVVHYRLALQAKQSGNAAHTADELRTAIALDPEEAYWHSALAEALWKLGDAAGAEKACAEAAHLSPLDSGLAGGCGLRGGKPAEEEQAGQGIADLTKPHGELTEPVPIHKPEPPYSQKARDLGLQGTTVLVIVISADGNVESARVVRPLGLGMDEQALKSVRTWTFKPCTQNGKPVPVRVMVEVTFRM
jgi:TonB family protein